MTDYLTVVEVLAIHEDQISRYGGSSGVRDAGLLEAALFRPQTGYYPDLLAEGAALWESLSQNHPFIDGNKRTGFLAAYVFFALNGWKLIAAEASAVEAALALVSGRMSEAEFASWLKAQSVRRT